MTGCSAPNCTAHSNKGDKFHRFPTDLERRKRWLINCRRAKWNPKPNDRLCSKHFEDSQYEQHRQDGKRQLKPFAVPTIFDVPNPPKRLSEIRTLPKRECIPLNIHVLENNGNDDNDNINIATVNDCRRCIELENEILKLKDSVRKLKEELANEKAKTIFLSNEQKKNALLGPKFITKWSKEGIIMGLKMRFALGKNGYTYLRGTGYPLPSYSTLNKRVQHVDVDFGILKPIIDLLKCKISSMSHIEKDCSLMIDEMEISGDLDFDKPKKKFVGQVTLGDRSKRGNHLTVVALRGSNTSWKQVVAFHVTGPSTTGTDMKNLIIGVIESVTMAGLHVRSVVSDMGGNNKALWAELNVKVSKLERKCDFHATGGDIDVMAGVPHLLKNWKSALLSSDIYLPNEIVTAENLPTNVVNGKYVYTISSR